MLRLVDQRAKVGHGALQWLWARHVDAGTTGQFERRQRVALSEHVEPALHCRASFAANGLGHVKAAGQPG